MIENEHLRKCTHAAGTCKNHDMRINQLFIIFQYAIKHLHIYIQLGNCNEMLCHGKLHPLACLMIDITFTTHIQKSSILISNTQTIAAVDQVNAITELTKDIQKLMSDPQYLDCTIICRGAKLGANKAILCLRSDVFRVSDLLNVYVCICTICYIRIIFVLSRPCSKMTPSQNQCRRR